MHALTRAIPAAAALLVVGDVDQLPSVGPGQVLGDLIGSGAAAVGKRSSVALLPLGRTDVLGRPGYGVFELSLWMTLPTTRRVSSGGSSC